MKYSKILIFSGIGCITLLLLVIGVRLQAQNTMKKEITIPKVNQINTQEIPRISQFRNLQKSSNWSVKGHSKNAEPNDSSDFYKVIVDNNLFRPLGWRPPNKEPQYTLIGTAIDPNGTRVEAFILEERSNKFFIAGIGSKVGDAIVKEIEQKKVTLDKNGETITLRSGNMQFLKSGGSRRSSPSRSESANRNQSDNVESSSKSFDKEAAKKKSNEEGMKKALDIRRRSGGVSQEDRERIMRQLRERGILRGDGREIVTFSID